MNEHLLFMLCSPDIEEAVVDWLLERDDIGGFTSVPASGHGSSSHAMSIAEQVVGRRRQTMFIVQADHMTALNLLESVLEHFGGTGLHYWLLPLAASGHLERNTVREVNGTTGKLED